MKKKTLPFLLILPFVIGILSVFIINFSVNLISEDLNDIIWSYRQNEAFKIDTSTKLEATPVGSEDALKDPLNELKWSISVSEGDPSDYATLEIKDNSYYINTHDFGNIKITVSNVRGTIAKSFNAVIYDTGVIIINPLISSTAGIEGTTYLGEYDYTDDGYQKATLKLSVEVIPHEYEKDLYIEELPSGITFENNTIKVHDVIDKVEEKSLALSTPAFSEPTRYNFSVVKDGYNVYNYDQLLDATNSSNPKIVVQQRHFESLANTYDGNNRLKSDDTTLFGHYDFETRRFSFASEVYRYETTYNRKFIDDWNKVKSTKLSSEVIAGLHITKDYYGNGYKLNGHNLAYPYGTTTSVQGVTIASLTADNLFRGPLALFALGDPSTLELARAYGQDNSLLYVEGDDITLRDINIRNADFGINLNNLNYTGNGIDIYGENVTIINSQIRNARQGVRVFSSKNTLIKNSLLSTSRQFLLSVGANEYETPNENETGVTYTASGELNSSTTKFKDYFAYPEKALGLNDVQSGNYETNTADGLISAFMLSQKGTSSELKKAMKALDNLINQEALVTDASGNPIYKGDVTVEDTYFYQSGIAAIALESMFNGPFLYNGLPSLLSTTLSDLVASIDVNKIGGVSYPVELILKGDTAFYDYKDVKSLDVSNLINENISEVLTQLDIGNGKVYTVDDIFPIRSVVENTATSKDIAVVEEVDENMVKYVNIPVIYYGGGLNLSKVNVDELNANENWSEPIELDLLSHILTSSSGDMITKLMQRSVLSATGFSSFNYYSYKNKYLYKANPDFELLKKRS